MRFSCAKNRVYSRHMASERRISHQLVNYWQHIKGDRLLPSVGDIDQDDIADMWEHCFLVQIHDNRDGSGISYAYDYVGDSLQELMLDEDGRASYLAALPYEKLQAFHEEMGMTNLPVVESVEDLPVNGQSIMFRMCLLPIGDGSGGVAAIFGGMRFKYI
jgi:hypothetical protein